MPENKKILIIGASSGLGRKLAELYAEDGCDVGIIGRRENLLKEVEQKYPGKIFIKKADIKDDTINAAINALIMEMGNVDMIIIAASIVNFNFSFAPESELETTDINVKGYLHVLNSAWHYFKQKGGGHIIGITSIAAARGNKMAPAYHASKAFQSIYLESLRIKAKHEKNNIIVTEIIPGYVDTSMGKGERLFWVSSIDKAAKLTKKAIAKKRTKAFVPKKWWFIYHIQKFMPTFIYDRIVNGSWKLKTKT
jgi:short-subunit dehydrogenase